MQQQEEQTVFKKQLVDLCSNLVLSAGLLDLVKSFLKTGSRAVSHFTKTSSFQPQLESVKAKPFQPTI